MDQGPAIEVDEVTRFQDFDSCGMGDLNGLSLDDVLTIRGWAIGSSSAATQVEVRSGDGKLRAEAPVRLSRPDVTLAVGDGVAGAETPGFVVELQPKGEGRTEFTVAVSFGDGETASLGRIVVSVGSGGGMQDVVWTERPVPSEREKVVVGKSGWLFLRQDTNDVIGQHTGKVAFDAQQRRDWREVLRRRVAAIQELEATWLCVVVPDKEAVYAEYLPDEIVPARRRTVHEFLDIAEEVGAPVIYALDALVREKKRGAVFVKTDTHWNQRGAFATYRMICSALRSRGVPVEPLNESSIRWSAEIVQGDLGAKLYPELASSEKVCAALDRRFGDLVYDNRVLNHGRVSVYEQDRPDLPSCVLFGESFAKNLLVFLQASFRRLVFVHTSMVIGEVLEQERPEVVLSVPVERFLLRVASDTEGLAKLEATARSKGGALPWPAKAR
jgi:alginate O-acetyltransferase complex protein AlgJ